MRQGFTWPCLRAFWLHSEFTVEAEVDCKEKVWVATSYAFISGQNKEKKYIKMQQLVCGHSLGKIRRGRIQTFMQLSQRVPGITTNYTMKCETFTQLSQAWKIADCQVLSMFC